ncbi:MAG: PhoH family protein, partial [Clostridiales bacterium]|nr:PhoH family protein [Clostridiales bacterium]
MIKSFKNDELRAVFGAYDANIKTLETLIPVTVRVSGDGVEISGSVADTELAGLLLDKLCLAVRRGENIEPDKVKQYYDILTADPSSFDDITNQIVCVTARGQKIYAKTLRQKKFIDAVNNNLVTFAIGPAGTGKTSLAVAMAANAV